MTLTDGDDNLLGLMECNLQRNRRVVPASTRVTLERLEWSRAAADAGPLPAGPFDWVLGSDVVYDTAEHAALCATLARVLRRDARRACRAVLVTMPRHRVPPPTDAGGQPRRETLHASGRVLRHPSSSSSGLFTDAALAHFVAVAAAHGLRVSPLAADDDLSGARPRAAAWRTPFERSPPPCQRRWHASHTPLRAPEWPLAHTSAR